jgi:hypothetical protein
MFKPSTLRIIAIIALVCCAINLAFSLYKAQKFGTMYIMAISWTLLLYSSYLGLRLAKYDLYDEDFKRLGISLYAIVLLSFLFSFLNIGLGIIPACYLAFRLHLQKSGMDKWISENKGQSENS